MKLTEAMIHIQYDPNWQIWANGTSPDSNWRYGQANFEQGGVLDDCNIFIGNGVVLGDYFSRELDSCFEDCNCNYDCDCRLDFLMDMSELFLESFD